MFSKISIALFFILSKYIYACKYILKDGQKDKYIYAYDMKYGVPYFYRYAWFSPLGGRPFSGGVSRRIRGKRGGEE